MHIMKQLRGIVKLKRRTEFYKKYLAMLLACVLCIITVSGNALPVLASQQEFMHGEQSEFGPIENFEQIAAYISMNGEERVLDEKEYWVVVVDDDLYIAYTDQNNETQLCISQKTPSITIEDRITTDNTISLLINKDLDRCEIRYSFCMDDLETVMVFGADIDLFTADTALQFFVEKNDNEISEESIYELGIEAEKIFKHNMPKWNDVLSELTGISFAQIGFNAWFDETSLLPEDELTNSEDDNSVSKSTEFEAESEAETDSVSETEAGSAEIVNTFIEDTTETEEVLVTEENTETEDETEITFSANEEELEITPILQEQYLIHIERIALNLGDATVYEGDSIKLKATVFPNNVIEKVTFSSPNSEIATVDDQGVVTGVGAGTVKIVATAETDENVFATCTIRVLPSEVTEEDSSAYEGEEICDGVWIAGFEPELLYTGTKVTQNVRVYDHKKLLKENIDYVVSYANNIDVATSDKINSPRMIITMRGKYIGKKTKYFGIRPADIAGARIITDDIALNYSGKEQKYVPVIYYGTNKLTNNKDYSIEYFADEERNVKATEDTFKGTEGANTAVYYKITGITGNFCGTIMGKYRIVNKENNLSKASLRMNTSIKYYGTAINAEDLNLRLSMPGKKDKINPITDANFTIKIVETGEIIDKDNPTINLITKPGTYTISVSTSDVVNNPYAGKIEKKFKIVGGYNLTKVAEIDLTNWMDEIEYRKEEADSVGIMQPSSMLLKVKENSAIDSGVTLTSGIDYTVTYTNNKKVGKAKVTFKGCNQYTGSITKTFNIIGNGQLDADVDESTVYLTGGALPNVTVKDAYDNVLTEKKDYKVTFKNNKKIGTASYRIVGKGNYAKANAIEGNFEVTPASLARCYVYIADKLKSNTSDDYKSVPVIYDSNGKKLTAGRDYSREFTYSYEGSELGKEPEAGAKVLVKIEGIGNFAGSTVTGEYKIISQNQSIDNLYIVVDPQEYTGQAVEPELSDIHVYPTAEDAEKENMQNEIEASDCLKIISYSDNVKIGNAKIVLAGIGEYGGSTTVTFAIKKKEYMSVPIDKIVMSLSGEFIGSKLPYKKSGIVTAAIEPGDAENKTIIWQTSNPDIISVNEINKIDETHIAAIVEAKGTGTAIIKAISQDSGVCETVTIEAVKVNPTNISIEEESLKKSVGESFQLSYTYTPNEAYIPEVEWKSSNTKAVTVDDTGLISCVGIGTSVVTVSYGNLSDICIVTVLGDTNPSNYINVVTAEDIKLIPNNASAAQDNSNNINRAIERYKNQGGATFYFPEGIYYFGYADSNHDNSCIYVGYTENFHFVLDENAVLMATAFNSDDDYNVVRFDRAKNCSFTGGKIVGDKEIRTYDDSESGMGIGIMKGDNISISDVEISKCWGDGIWIGDASRGWDGVRDSYYITVSNCNIHHNRRNNISLVGAKCVTILGCKFNYAKGTAPQFGMDIEPNSDGVVEHVLVKQSEFLGNTAASVGIIKPANDVEFNECKFDGPIYNLAGSNIRFVNCQNGR